MSARIECHHCGAEIEQYGYEWVHVAPADPTRPAFCWADKAFLAIPAQ